MERYEAYKDSGVEWIGEIPEGWETKRISSIYSIRKEPVDGGNPNDLLSVSEYYGVDYRRNRISSTDVLARAESLEGYQRCHPNDLVMNIMLAWKGAQGTSPHKGIASPSYGVFKPCQNCMPRYYHYLFRTDQYREYFKSFSSGIIDSRLRLYPEVFLHLHCHAPSIKEQRAIADYLDAKTAEIDALVDDCEREVELLREYRKAIISEAVTKGLDPTAPMKESGELWAARIPDTWSMAKTGLFIRFHSGDSLDSLLLNDSNQYPVYGGGSVKGYHTSYNIEQATVLVSRQGATCGTTRFIPEKAWATEHALIANPLVEMNAKWLTYTLASMELGRYSMTSAQPGISAQLVENMAMPIIPLKEQAQIADYLDAKTAEIDSLIEAKQQMADKLREYRKSLISEAVTGKFKVPGVR